MEGIVFSTPDLEPFVSLHLDQGKQRYLKELIYEGKFVKKTPTEETRFTVDDARLNHWARGINEFLKDGVEIPLPLGHTESPLARQATIVGARLGLNRNRKRALYAEVEFKDAEAEKLALTANVSIYVPPGTFTTGTGKTFSDVIRHVALTDYPVIPGLEGFKAIVASLEGEPSMADLRGIATKLEVPEDITGDAELLAAIDTAIDAWIEEWDALIADDDTEIADVEPEPIAAAFVTAVQDNRSMKVDALVQRGITPAVIKQLKKRYCEPDKVRLALSHKTPDDFDTVVAALALNEPVKIGEHSGVQLSHPLPKLDDTNPVVANAKARAAKRK